MIKQKSILMWVLTGVFLLMLLEVKAQYAITFDNIDGRPLYANLHAGVQGEPMLFKDWTQATVHLQNGEKLKNVKVKYDLIDDLLIFTDNKDQLFYFRQKVNEFWLHREGEADLHFKSGFPAFDGQTTDNFYQILVDGPVPLLKSRKKSVQESQVYGGATTQRILHDVEGLLVFKDGQLIKIRKNEKAVLDALKGDRAEMKELISKNKYNLRKDEDLIAFFRDYNAN